jgi:transposase InsO family protein
MRRLKQLEEENKAKLRDDRRPATQSNETWAMDFVHNQLATGRKLRVLTIVDIFSRFSPSLEPRLSAFSEKEATSIRSIWGNFRPQNELGYGVLAIRGGNDSL